MMVVGQTREIYALDFAVSHLLITIDEQMWPMAIGWETLGQSFTYEIFAQLADESVSIRIYPRSWCRYHTSFIFCRFAKDTIDEAWRPFEGTIWARFLPALNHGINFHFHSGFISSSYILPGASGLSECEMLYESARKRRPDLAAKNIL